MFSLRSLAFALVGLVALSAGHVRAQPKKPPVPEFPPIKEAMKEKQDRAHAILDALTAGDHDTLRREATGLLRIAELRVFVTSHKTEEYQFQAQKLKRAAEEMVSAAKAKNLDGAALAYSDMTRTCVQCHTHFRGVKKD